MNLALLLTCTFLGSDPEPRPAVVVVVGAEGTPEYGAQFRQWASRWVEAAARGKAECLQIGTDESAKSPDRELLRQAIIERSRGSEPLWLVLIGHGTFDGKTARFNLRGDDVSAAELAAWLKEVERPLAIINCASSSGPFLNELSGPGGYEHNYSRFGDYLSAAIADPRADLDKDEQTSLLEAYLMASAAVREFYERDGRLATEHALLDDNGDRLGTPADWFEGVRAVKSAKEGAPVDGPHAARWHLVKSPREESLPAELRARRDALEQELAAVRLKKSELSEKDYLNRLEPLLLELARLYERAAELSGR
jgi:hypothetical protein